MADKKISALTGATTPLAGTEVLPIVQSGATVKVSVASLTTGRSPTMNYAMMQNGIIVQNSSVNRWIIHREASALDDLYIYRYTDAGVLAGIPVQINRSTGNVRLEGNVIQGTAAKGVNFTANTPKAGMTSQLLNAYEEGTWTPVFESLDASFTYTEQYGSYTKVGRLVIAQFRLKVNAATGTVSNSVNIAGLPFTSANLGSLSGGGVAMGLQNFTGFVIAGSSGNNSTTITLWKQGTTSQPIASDTAGVFLNGTAMYFAA